LTVQRSVRIAAMLMLAVILFVSCAPDMQPVNGLTASDTPSPASESVIVSSSGTASSEDVQQAVQQRAEEIWSQFIDQSVIGKAADFALEHGCVLEQDDQTINIEKVGEFLEAYESGGEAELIVLKSGRAFGYYFVYLLQTTGARDYNVTLSCNPLTQSYVLDRFEQTENEVVFLGNEEQSLYLPLYIGKNGTNGYTRFCELENWEHTIDTGLIELVGEVNYLQWLQESAQDSLRFQRCMGTIGYFLKWFNIDYDTFVDTVGADTTLYDLERIKKEVYSQYMKITTTETDPEKIGALCFEAWMNKKMSKKEDDGTQVTACTLNSVELFAGDINEFAIRVTYDYTVSLTDKGLTAQYAAGGGEYDGNGGFTGASYEMRIKKVGATAYAIQGIGTGGGGQGLIFVPQDGE
ncbi:MAG: hypothetical protein ACERKO_11230, partial [Acetanaerobacterium sp.]